LLAVVAEAETHRKGGRCAAFEQVKKCVSNEHVGWPYVDSHSYDLVTMSPASVWDGPEGEERPSATREHVGWPTMWLTLPSHSDVYPASLSKKRKQ